MNSFYQYLAFFFEGFLSFLNLPLDLFISLFLKMMGMVRIMITTPLTNVTPFNFNSLIDFISQNAKSIILVDLILILLYKVSFSKDKLASSNVNSIDDVISSSRVLSDENKIRVKKNLKNLKRKNRGRIFNPKEIHVTSTSFFSKILNMTKTVISTIKTIISDIFSQTAIVGFFIASLLIYMIENKKEVLEQNPPVENQINTTNKTAESETTNNYLTNNIFISSFLSGLDKINSKLEIITTKKFELKPPSFDFDNKITIDDVAKDVADMPLTFSKKLTEDDKKIATKKMNNLLNQLKFQQSKQYSSFLDYYYDIVATINEKITSIPVISKEFTSREKHVEVSLNNLIEENDSGEFQTSLQNAVKLFEENLTNQAKKIGTFQQIMFKIEKRADGFYVLPTFIGLSVAKGENEFSIVAKHEIEEISLKNF